MYRLTELDAAAPPALLPHRRAEIEAVWREYVGPLPDPVEPRITVHAEEDAGSFVRQRVSFPAPGDVVTALLLIPHRRTGESVVALHPTNEVGKDSIAGPEGYRPYGVELAERGFVVLAPDTLTAGERIEDGEKPYHTRLFYERNPGWTAHGRMITDHRQSVEVLCSLPEVDIDRVGAIGHSLGAYNAIYLAGLDERVRATVASCGAAMFVDDPEPGRWGQRDWFSHLPRLSEDLANGVVPFEWHEIASLVAPRSLFVFSTRADVHFPNPHAIAAGMAQLGKLYDELGGRLEFVLEDGPHDFPTQVRTRSYAFLQEELSRARTSSSDT